MKKFYILAIMIGLAITGFSQKNKVETQMLSFNKDVHLSSQDGKDDLITSKKTFPYLAIGTEQPDTNRGEIAANLSYLGFNQLHAATPKASLEVYRIISGGTFNQILDFLTDRPGEGAMSQNQIITFCKKYPQYLSDKSTLFLTCLDLDFPDYYMISVAKLLDGSLCASVYSREDNRFWTDRNIVIIRNHEASQESLDY